MSIKQIIFNCDDFGLSDSAVNGAFQLINGGIVKSISIMANYAYHNTVSLELFKGTHISIGCHLNITAGKPITKWAGKSIINKCGEFYGGWNRVVYFLLKGKLDINEVYEEWFTQIKYLLDAGLKVDHLDSHHHIHFLPQLFEIAVKLQKFFGISFLRRVNPVYRFDHRVGLKHTLVELSSFFADTGPLPATYPVALFLDEPDFTENSLKRLLKKVKEGKTAEIVCHPAYFKNPTTQKEVLKNSEIDYFLSTGFKELLQKLKLEIINFSNLQ